MRLRLHVMTLGRARLNDVLVEDDGVSAAHAEIVLEGGVHLLIDRGSTNGTWLNGRRITLAPVIPGDLVVLGRTSIHLV
ncbi:MAG: FHA domain-containing protein [Proteobacteria bacterium]|nr:FHA domain-containing protein [Pseudomonadota bacterium]MCP4915933.1 FHA domain-containing protein [Pseudomonadota bacterium]